VDDTAIEQYETGRAHQVAVEQEAYGSAQDAYKLQQEANRAAAYGTAQGTFISVQQV